MRVVDHLKQLAGESVIYGVAGTIGILTQLILTPLVTHVFPPAQYGIIELVDVLFLFVMMFALLGLDSASARWFFDSDDPADRRKTTGSWFWCQVVVSVALALLLIGLAPGVSWLVTGSSENAPLVALSAAALPLQLTQRVFGSWLRYQRRAWAAVAFSSGVALGSVAMVILFIVVWRQGLEGLYTARLIAFFLAASAAVLLLRKWISPKTFSWERLQKMLIFGLPFIPAAVGFWGLKCADRFLLSRLCDPSEAAAEVGLFALAVKVSMGVGVVVTAFTYAWTPFAYSILRQPNARRVYARVLDAYSYLGCGLSTATALCAPLLVWILAPGEYASQYAPAASGVAFLAFGVLFNGAFSIAAIGSSVVKNSIPSLVAVLIGLAASIGLNLFLIPRFGRDGAAVASMIAWFVGMAYLFAASQRNHPIPYHWGRSLACLACSFAILGADHWLVPPDGPAAWLLRAALLLLFLPLGVALGLIRWHHRPEKQHEAALAERPDEGSHQPSAIGYQLSESQPLTPDS